MSLVPIELQKVYRQQDERFVEVLDKIRNNTATREELDLLNSRYLPQYEPEKDNFSITLATRRDQVDYINENRLSGLPGKEYTFTGTIKGDFPEGSLPTSLELVVKTGAQVIFIKNDPERRWVNGTIGMISDITPDEKIEVVLESGEMYELERCVWENIKYTYNEKEKTIEESVLGTFLQFPIRLAWAITVHKSQGLTFNRVIVDFTGGAFAGGTDVCGFESMPLSGRYCVETADHASGYIRKSRYRTVQQRFQRFCFDRTVIEARTSRSSVCRGCECFRRRRF